MNTSFAKSLAGVGPGYAPDIGGEVDRSTRASAWQVFLCIFVLGLAFSFLVPPDMSPDEHDHIMRAYTIAHGQLLLEPADSAGNSGGAVDTGLIEYLNVYRGLQPDGRMTMRRYQDGLRARWTGELVRVPFPGTGFYFPAIYLPHALALWIGERAGWSIDASYRLMRAMTLALALAGMAAAFRISRPNPFGFVLLLLPMSMFQIVSPTIDGVSLMLAVLTLSTFVALWRASEKPSSLYWIAFHISLFVLVNGRAQALPLLALPFVLFAAHRRSRDLGIAIAQTLCALAWIALVARYNVDTRIAGSLGLRAAAVHYGGNPAELLTVVWHTLTNKARLQFYGNSFVGVLGWLDIYLPPAFYTFTAIVLLATFVASAGRPASRRDLLAAGTMLLLALASTAIVFFAMLATWTTQPARDIEGVQGRYFMLPALIAAWAMMLAFPRPVPFLRWIASALISVYLVAAVWVSGQALLDRYWLRGTRIALNESAGESPRQPVFLPRGSVLEARFSAPVAGSLDALVFQIGTVRGKADGTIMLKACDDSTCASGQVDLRKVTDNGLVVFALDRPLTATPRAVIRLALRSTSQSAGAIWVEAATRPDIGTALNGAPVPYIPRMYGEFSLSR